MAALGTGSGTGSGKVLGMVLAGGQGSRLDPLTARRAKPAVPFGAKYRIIDFILNNLVNSSIYSIYVLTQFRAQSLTRHIQRYWRFGAFLDSHFIELVPAQMFRFEELGPVWYRGTADALYQNQHLIEDLNPETVAVFGGDHIFKMNIRHMLDYHLAHRADLCLAGYSVPIEQASRFGVLEVNADWQLTGFQEKPAQPTPIPGQPDRALISMGNYLFRAEALHELLEQDAEDTDSSHDFGKDIIPRALAEGYSVQVYDFLRNPIPGQEEANSYWRDVGTLDAYYEASMDLVQVVPAFDLYNEQWPLRSSNSFSPPVKFVHETGERRGVALNSLLASGCIISGGLVRESVFGRRVRVNSFAKVEQSVLFDEVEVGRGAQLRRCIVDKNVVLPPKVRVGFDPEEDRSRGFHLTELGVTVVPEHAHF